MARIKGVDIPNEKRVEVSLTYIFGIGKQLANRILKATNVDPSKKAKDLTEEEIGIRHRKGLPVRGQRTNRNARTRKGKGKPVANKKK